MANKYLLPIFKRLYGRDFSYGNFDQRLEMQKAVYLLQDMGVPVGDYGFRSVSYTHLSPGLLSFNIMKAAVTSWASWVSSGVVS